MTSTLVFLALFSFAQKGPMDLQRELDEAEALAIRGHADAAIDTYRSLQERGIDFVGLRYNLGTLHLERGELGFAVLHLKAALRMDPRHADARFNLERALGARADELEGAKPSPGVVASLVHRVRSNEAALALTLALALFVIALTLWPWTQRASASRSLCTSSLVVTGVTLALCAWLLGSRAYSDGIREGVVLDEEVSARAGPSEDAAASFTAHAGLHGLVVEEEPGWVRLRLENGLDAWFPRTALGFVGGRP